MPVIAIFPPLFEFQTLWEFERGPLFVGVIKIMGLQQGGAGDTHDFRVAFATLLRLQKSLLQGISHRERALCRKESSCGKDFSSLRVFLQSLEWEVAGFLVQWIQKTSPQSADNCENLAEDFSMSKKYRGILASYNYNEPDFNACTQMANANAGLTIQTKAMVFLRRICWTI